MACNAEDRWCDCYYHGLSFERSIEWLAAWDAIRPVWRHRNDIHYLFISVCVQNNICGHGLNDRFRNVKDELWGWNRGIMHLMEYWIWYLLSMFNMTDGVTARISCVIIVEPIIDVQHLSRLRRLPCIRMLSCWRHQMETFSALLAICAGNSPVPGEIPAQKPVTWSFDVFFDLRLNKRLSKQSWGWWFETLSRQLWRHCNDKVEILCMIYKENRLA